MNKKILMVTDLSFPEGSAMASRLLSFCKLFHEIGYDVHVITGKYEGSKYQSNTLYEMNEYSFEIINSKRSYLLQTFLGNENLGKAVDTYLRNNKVNIVFSTSLNVSFTKINRICRKYKVKQIIEQCEWYDPSSFRFGKFDPRYHFFCLNIKHNFLHADGIISISRLLDNYYKSKGVNSIRIPAIYDVENTKYLYKTNNNMTNLIYTGNPSKSKELLLPIIEAINSKEEYQEKIRLDIYGCDRNQIIRNIGRKDVLNNESIVVHGFVSGKEIMKAIQEADYQIFIKPLRKSSNACFPTKLCESMASGTPVIANNTGDINLYLENDINGYVVSGTSSADICNVFDRMLNLDSKKYSILRRNARLSALKSFDYRIYKKTIEEYLNEYESIN